MPCIRLRLRHALASAALLALSSAALAQPASPLRISDNVVKIGVLTDLSGVSSENAGKGSIVAAQLAVDEFSKDRKVLCHPYSRNCLFLPYGRCETPEQSFSTAQKLHHHLRRW